MKRLFRRTQKVRFSHAENAVIRQTKNEQVAAIYRDYLDDAQYYVNKGQQARQSLAGYFS